MRKAIILFCLFIVADSFAQDIDYARHLIDTLTSPSMEGRGYVNDGDRKAANFICKEFQKDGLLNFANDFYQRFNIAINTFPGKAEISIGKTPLTPGEEYLVASNSPTVKGEFPVVMLDERILKSKTRFKRFCLRDYSQKVIVVDKKGISDKKQSAQADSIRKYNFLKARGIVLITDNKLVWSISAASR